MTLHSPDQRTQAPQSSIPEKTGIYTLLLKYRNSIKLVLGTAVLTASGVSTIHAHRDDSTNLCMQYVMQRHGVPQSNMLKELSIDMIESRREGTQKWIIWAIEYIQKQEEHNTCSRLNNTLDIARKLEQLILDKTNPEGEAKLFTNFSFPIVLTQDSLRSETEFFEAVLTLYKLRNPGNEELVLSDLITLHAVFVIDFAVDMIRDGNHIKKLDRYYIHRISLTGPENT